MIIISNKTAEEQTMQYTSEPQEHKSFVLYTDWFNHVKYLSMEERGELFTAILAFAATRERSELDGAVGLAFSVIADQIERDSKRWESVRKKRSEAGRRGAEKRFGTPAVSTAQPVTPDPDDDENEPIDLDYIFSPPRPEYLKNRKTKLL